MGIFDRRKNRRNIESAVEGNYSSIFTSRGNSITVSENNITEIPSVKNALDLITGAVSNLPIYLYKENEDGSIERQREDYREKLLNEECNNMECSSNLKRNMTKDMLLHGISYSVQDKEYGDILGLYRIEPKQVQLNKLIDKKGFIKDLTVNYTLNGVYVEDLEIEDFLIIPYNSKDGLRGKGILSTNQDILGLMLSEIIYQNNVVSGGALPLGLLETDGKLSEITAKRLRESWENVYGGLKNSGKTVILEEGLKYKSLSLTPNDLGLLDSRKTHTELCEEIFNLPKGMLSNSTAIQNEAFLKFTLNPILSSIESALNKTLLLEEEKEEGYYFRFDVSELLKASFKEQVETISTATKNGLFTINEGRALLDMKPFLDKDFLLLSQGNVKLNADGVIEVFNTIDVKRDNNTE
ncbi:phage portal protein [Terrisporobacter vanillatitrophus]|uniref:phage portal protein n=1 Tax=Terrisporobacter vanillatitrophus TaxID=3058402 RepID=UPI003367B624